MTRLIVLVLAVLIVWQPAALACGNSDVTHYTIKVTINKYTRCPSKVRYIGKFKTEKEAKAWIEKHKAPNPVYADTYEIITVEEQ
jgi:hypothetical protein